MSSSNKEITSARETESAGAKSKAPDAKASADESAPPTHSAAVNSSPPATTEELTAEEQMALYEKELKENDWGHQPC